MGRLICLPLSSSLVMDDVQIMLEDFFCFVVVVYDDDDNDDRRFLSPSSSIFLLFGIVSLSYDISLLDLLLLNAIRYGYGGVRHQQLSW